MWNDRKDERIFIHNYCTPIIDLPLLHYNNTLSQENYASESDLSCEQSIIWKIYEGGIIGTLYGAKIPSPGLYDIAALAAGGAIQALDQVKHALDTTTADIIAISAGFDSHV